jgi:hypothetical protein
MHPNRSHSSRFIDSALAVFAAAVFSLSAGGCGESDEDRVRTAIGDFAQSFNGKEPERVCGLMTPRAEAQLRAFIDIFQTTGRCVKVLEGVEPSGDSGLAPRLVANAAVAVRGDLATVKPHGDHAAIGLREVDGEWRVDTFFDASLREPPKRGEARLARGSDERQIRATTKARGEAMRRKDYRRLCNLMSYSGEAQFLVGAASVSFSGVGGPFTWDFSCAQAIRKIVAFNHGRVRAPRLPSSARIAAARVSIRGAKATIKPHRARSTAMVRLDGRWLIEADTYKVE